MSSFEDSLVTYVIGGVVALSTSIGAFLVRNIYNRLMFVERDLAAHKVKVAENTITKNQIQEYLAGITEALQNLTREINRREDKQDVINRSVEESLNRLREGKADK